MLATNAKLRLYETDTDVFLIDGPTNRRTIRASADGKVVLTIGHTDSGENGKNYPTQRSVVRVSQTFDVSESPDTVDCYVQLVMSTPKGQVTAEQLGNLVAQLIEFIHQGDSPNETGFVAGNLATVARLYAGES